jgi:hypothetical protein
MTTSSLHTIFVVLGLPQTPEALITRMNAILQAMTANKIAFPSPPVALATAQSHVDALVVAQAAMKTRATGTKQVRDDALKLVVEDANQLHGYVQLLCNASPTQASTIAADAAMTLRKSGVRAKHDLTVKQGISGTVKAVAGNVKGAKAHEWQCSTDGGKTWSTLPPDDQGKHHDHRVSDRDRGDGETPQHREGRTRRLVRSGDDVGELTTRVKNGEGPAMGPPLLSLLR